MEVDVSIADALVLAPPLDEQLLRQMGQGILEHLDRHSAELSVLITTDSDIQSLNRDYRHIDRPTDVLSFSQQEAPEALTPVVEQMLGDVVISLETAARQAEEQGHSTATEVLRLLIHGVLHLIGYEHEEVPEAEAQEMFRKEEELFNTLHHLVQ